MVAIANSSGLISTNIFRAQDEPKYIPALATSAAIGGLTCVGALAWGIYMRVVNRQRNKAQGLPKNYGSKDVPTELLGKGASDPGTFASLLSVETTGLMVSQRSVTFTRCAMAFLSRTVSTVVVMTVWYALVLCCAMNRCTKSLLVVVVGLNQKY